MKTLDVGTTVVVKAGNYEECIGVIDKINFNTAIVDLPGIGHKIVPLIALEEWHRDRNI